MSQCGTLFPSRDAVSPKDQHGCVLERSHFGPHEFVCGSLRVTWETDMQCNCEDCQSEEPDDWCIVFRAAPMADTTPPQ